jgi:peroxiredoxin
MNSRESRRKKATIVIVSILIVIIILLGGLYILAIQMSGCFQGIVGVGLKTGTVAPDFILKNLNGDDVQLSQFRGKVVLIDFWAIFCKPCIIALPKIQEIHEKYNNKELVVLAINVSEEKNKIQEFIEENDYTFQVLLGSGNMNVQKNYGVINIPHTYIIDKQGKVAYSHIEYGPNNEKQLVTEIYKLLKETSE